MKGQKRERERERTQAQKPNEKKKEACVGENKRFDHGAHVCVFIYQNAMKTQF